MTLKPEPTPGDTTWFVHDRFGLFIHWGTYALAARHEWVKSKEKIDTETYMKYFRHFDPDLYDPNQWAEAAANAGMKYFVVTTKHHEGFCLWDTQFTSYKATNTPCGRDLIAPMVEAFRSRGLRAGFYYSLLDWHHPHYTVDRHHPMRQNPEFIAGDAQRDMNLYADYMRNQVRELLTRYGPIDILWCDFSFGADSKAPGFENRPECGGKGKEQWQSEKLIELVRSLQPRIILNNRLQIPQDIYTPEQVQPAEWFKVDGKPVVWEACQTFSGSWGYHRDEESWKSVDQLVRMLIDTVSKGGNLLLNVGPTARGEFDERALDRLRGIGEWMKRHSRSIYGCTQAPDDCPAPQDCRYTYNPQTRRLYLHVFAWPFKHLHLPAMGGRVEYAQLLNDASEIAMLSPKTSDFHAALQDKVAPQTLTLLLPVKKPNATVPVIELFLKG